MYFYKPPQEKKKPTEAVTKKKISYNIPPENRTSKLLENEPVEGSIAAKIQNFICSLVNTTLNSTEWLRLK